MHFFEQLIAVVAAWIVAFMTATGYWGVAGLMAIESACIPLPSEIIMPFAGYLASIGTLNLFWAATAGAVGCNIGSIFAYEAGKHGGRRFVARYGRFVLMSEHDLDRAEHFFRRYGSIAVLVCRLLPGIRSFIAFPAGVARMPLGRFHFYTFVGSWPWCFGLAWAGHALGKSWQTDPRLSGWLHRVDAVLGLVLVVGAVWFIWHRVKGSKSA
ncbi:MAG TPA: DedA family protein [Sphingomonas sp.]|jgi:membrane protein DedA with SNARE-associated domain|uniref:DedA family protein n=1 Tax=Sphingomonas sp. TaxID=28214 RepID=UPI002EDAB651